MRRTTSRAPTGLPDSLSLSCGLPFGEAELDPLEVLDCRGAADIVEVPATVFLDSLHDRVKGAREERFERSHENAPKTPPIARSDCFVFLSPRAPGLRHRDDG